MDPKKELQNVPKLRFPGFQGKWGIDRLEEKMEFLAGYAFKSEKMLNQTGRFQLIKMSNVYKNELRLDRNASYWEELNTNLEKFLLRKDDVILTLTGTVNKRDYGYSVNVPEDGKFLLNQRLASLRKKNDKSAGGFIRQVVLTGHFLYQFFSNSKGGTGNQSNVSIEDLKNIRLNFPSLPEQQKIAAFLSAVDNKIQQLTRKKKLLEQYKKGVMQKIFSQEIRFKREDGSDYPDWEEKRLGEVASEVSYGLNAAATEYDGENKYIRITDIDDESRKFDPSPLTSTKGGLDRKYRVRPGDILFARTGASVGKTYLFDENDGQLFFAGFLIRCSITSANSYFVFLQTLMPDYQKWVKTISMRSGQPGINSEEYKTLEIRIPNRDEQDKIAVFVSKIDQKIVDLDSQITQIQQFKKGLLQQMFV